MPHRDEDFSNDKAKKKGSLPRMAHTAPALKGAQLVSQSPRLRLPFLRFIFIMFNSVYMYIYESGTHGG